MTVNDYASKREIFDALISVPSAVDLFRKNNKYKESEIN